MRTVAHQAPRHRRPWTTAVHRHQMQRPRPHQRRCPSLLTQLPALRSLSAHWTGRAARRKATKALRGQAHEGRGQEQRCPADRARGPCSLGFLILRCEPHGCTVACDPREGAHCKGTRCGRAVRSHCPLVARQDFPPQAAHTQPTPGQTTRRALGSPRRGRNSASRRPLAQLSHPRDAAASPPGSPLEQSLEGRDAPHHHTAGRHLRRVGAPTARPGRSATPGTQEASATSTPARTVLPPPLPEGAPLHVCSPHAWARSSCSTTDPHAAAPPASHTAPRPHRTAGLRTRPSSPEPGSPRAAGLPVPRRPRQTAGPPCTAGCMHGTPPAGPRDPHPS